jgi:6-phosphogluconate dehydrogenase
MRIGMVGLGRMGANMARRLLRGGHAVVGHDRAPGAAQALAADGGEWAPSLEALVAALPAPRALWVMVPAGAPTEEALAALEPLLAPGDVVVDGGNSFYQDAIRRSRRLGARGIALLDAGTSGGVHGLERGYCLMIGGEADAFRRLEPIFRALAPGRGATPPAPGRAGRGGTAEEGYLHVGPSGAGHFVKMVHNGIEYALMQAYAEGFDLLRAAGSEAFPPERRYAIDPADVAELWRRGSVVGSWLLDLAAGALARDPALAGFSGRVADSGEGRWTVLAAVEAGVPAHALAAALFARFRSQQEATYGDRLLSALRHAFGGHGEATPRGEG